MVLACKKMMTEYSTNLTVPVYFDAAKYKDRFHSNCSRYTCSAHIANLRIL